MSYDVVLRKNEEVVKVKSHQEGGIIAIGGSGFADMSITYNYARVYSLVDFSVKDLAGKVASATITQLEELVEKLGDDPYDDYWTPTPGNAGHALVVLLGWAQQHPDAIWGVT